MANRVRLTSEHPGSSWSPSKRLSYKPASICFYAALRGKPLPVPPLYRLRSTHCGKSLAESPNRKVLTLALCMFVHVLKHVRAVLHRQLRVKLPDQDFSMIYSIRIFPHLCWMHQTVSLTVACLLMQVHWD